MTESVERRTGRKEVGEGLRASTAEGTDVGVGQAQTKTVGAEEERVSVATEAREFATDWTWKRALTRRDRRDLVSKEAAGDAAAPGRDEGGAVDNAGSREGQRKGSSREESALLGQGVRAVIPCQGGVTRDPLQRNPVEIGGEDKKTRQDGVMGGVDENRTRGGEEREGGEGIRKEKDRGEGTGGAVSAKPLQGGFYCVHLSLEAGAVLPSRGGESGVDPTEATGKEDTGATPATRTQRRAICPNLDVVRREGHEMTQRCQIADFRGVQARDRGGEGELEGDGGEGFPRGYRRAEVD